MNRHDRFCRLVEEIVRQDGCPVMDGHDYLDCLDSAYAIDESEIPEGPLAEYARSFVDAFALGLEEQEALMV